MLIAVRKINACKLPTSTIEWSNYAKYNPSAFCDDLRDIPWDDVLKERNVNTAWSNWKELFLNVCDRHAPYKRKIVWGVKCPWLTGETKSLWINGTFSNEKQEGLELRWTGMPIGDYEIKCQITLGMKNVAIVGMKFRKILIALKPFGKQLRKFFQARKASQRVKIEEGHTTTTTSFICMTKQTHTVLQKLCLGINITTQGNYVTLIIICHEHQNKLKYILWIVYW